MMITDVAFWTLLRPKLLVCWSSHTRSSGENARMDTGAGAWAPYCLVVGTHLHDLWLGLGAPLSCERTGYRITAAGKIIPTSKGDPHLSWREGRGCHKRETGCAKSQQDLYYLHLEKKNILLSRTIHFSRQDLYFKNYFNLFNIHSNKICLFLFFTVPIWVLRSYCCEVTSNFLRSFS